MYICNHQNNMTHGYHHNGVEATLVLNHIRLMVTHW